MCVWFMLFGFHSQSATQDMFVFMEIYFIHLLFFLCYVHVNATLESVVYDAQNRQSVFEEGI